MRKFLPLLLLLTLLGCAVDDRVPEERTLEPVVETVPAITTTETGIPPSSATVSTSASTTPSTATTAEPTVPATFVPGAGGVEPQGLPETFLAVREDHAVVEIETASGRTIRTIIPPPGGPDFEPGFSNTIGQVWWDRETGRMAVEEGPEPAGGHIWHQLADANPEEVQDLMSAGTEGFRWGGGWDAAISPNGRYVFHTGYFASILEHGVSSSDAIEADWRDGQFEGYYSNPAWLRNRVGVAYTSETWDDGEGQHAIEVVELDPTGAITEHRIIPIPNRLADLDVRTDGMLVALVDDGDRTRFGGSQAQVIDPDRGETVAEFELEPGSSSMEYDPTGTYLLYVDGDGTARWQGRGQSGVLANRLIHADW